MIGCSKEEEKVNLMKYIKRGFTLVELLTVLAIITILLGMIVPATDTIRTLAKVTKQKAQLGNLDIALSVFRNDNGYFPPSAWTPSVPTGTYCGAQKLAEALLGRDLMGFHPQSNWDALDTTWYNPATLHARKDRYLELSTANPFRLGDVFDNTGPLAPETFVLCDVFGTRKVELADKKMVKAGAPVLYYRANTSSKTMADPMVAMEDRIYDATDNVPVVMLKGIQDGQDHPLGWAPGPYKFFYGNPAEELVGYIQDTKLLPDNYWPYRPDSYLLITAGPDGIYGNGDDICNFGN